MLRLTFCGPISVDWAACYLFSYHGYTVAIDLIGAGIPLVLSVLFVFVLFRRRRQFDSRRLGYYAAFTAVFGALSAGEYLVWDYLFGGISVQTQLFIFSVIYPAGVVQFLLFDRKAKESFSALKSYPIATVSAVLSDLFRTFSGQLNVSPQIIGGNGPYDGVFLGGLYMTIAYLGTAAVYLRAKHILERRRARSLVPGSNFQASRAEYRRE